MTGRVAMNSRLASTAMVLALCLGAAGCATAPSNETTGSITRDGASYGAPEARIDGMSAPQLRGEEATLGRAYAAKPSDKATALRYSTVLQMNGQSDQALAVMRKLAIAYPTDREVLAAYGKALAGTGQLEPALDAIRRAQTPEYPDWKLLSAEGAIVDQLGRRDEARAIYRRALDLKPNDPSVLSNLGMSYVLEGNLRTAETYLQQAVAQPGADSRVRQNFALVVGLQGRFDEAEKIAGRELSPDQARANVAYLRAMLAQQNAWSQLKADDKGRKSATN